MPKKPSDFLNKKRSRGNGDFARPKAKVGRKVKRRAGETDASFQTRQLSITEQSVAKDRAGAKVSRRGLTLDEHLGQLARVFDLPNTDEGCADHVEGRRRLLG